MIYCKMENTLECGDGGWTLALKINGSKVNKCFESLIYDAEMNSEDLFPLAGCMHLCLPPVPRLCAHPLLETTVTASIIVPNCLVFWYLECTLIYHQ